MLKQTWILFIQRLLSPMKKNTTCHQSTNALWLINLERICNFLDFLAPLQLFLLQLQLQHDSAELHVKVVRPLQFPLIVLTDVQSMPEKKKMMLMSLCIRMTESNPPALKALISSTVVDKGRMSASYF